MLISMVTMVEDEAEAEKIFEWLKEEINNTWKNRSKIKPSFEVSPKPKILDILKLLPKDNCQECGLATCLVFAVQVSDGARSYNDCPKLDPLSKAKLKEYLNRCPPTA
jgi:ArsR family metal-binding transcriptional regulator